MVPAFAAEEEISRLLQISGPRCDRKPHIEGSRETVRAELYLQYLETTLKKKKKRLQAVLLNADFLF